MISYIDTDVLIESLASESSARFISKDKALDILEEARGESLPIVQVKDIRETFEYEFLKKPLQNITNLNHDQIDMLEYFNNDTNAFNSYYGQFTPSQESTESVVFGLDQGHKVVYLYIKKILPYVPVAPEEEAEKKSDNFPPGEVIAPDDFGSKFMEFHVKKVLSFDKALKSRYVNDEDVNTPGNSTNSTYIAVAGIAYIFFGTLLILGSLCLLPLMVFVQGTFAHFFVVLLFLAMVLVSTYGYIALFLDTFKRSEKIKQGDSVPRFTTSEFRNVFKRGN